MAGRFLMWVLTSFVGALLFSTFLGLRGALILAVILLVAFVPFLFIKFSLRLTVIACLLAGILGVGLFASAEIPALKIQRLLVNQVCSVSGTVVDAGKNSSETLASYKIRLESINGNEVRSFYPFYAYLYAYDPFIELGSSISGTVSFFESPIDFGRGREEMVVISGFSDANHLTVVSPEHFNWRKSFAQFQSSVQNRISHGAEATQGFLKSVCFGDKSEMDPNLKVSLRRIGLSHVTAVSGLHLTYALLFFNALCIFLKIPYRVRYLMGIFVALFFTALVGFPASCVRACVMWIFVAIGMAFDLIADGLTSLSVAALLITVIQPFAVRDIGFLLSVLATIGMITLRAPIETFLFPKILRERSPRLNGVYRKFTGIIAASVGVAITTLPITISVFGYVSLIAPLANAVLIMPIQAFFILGLLMVMVDFIPYVGILLGWLCDILYLVIDVISKFLAQLPFAGVSSLDYSGVLILVVFLGMLGVSLYHFFHDKRRSFMALLLVFLCFCGTYSAIRNARKPEEYVEITFVDVGQGDCTVISKGNRAVIIDYGGSSSKRYNLIEYLRKRDIYSVELLAFTHLHNDHTNGISTLINAAYVDRVIYPELNADSQEIYAMITTQNSYTISDNSPITVLDDVVITPIAGAVFDSNLEKENERCVCYRVEFGTTSVFITGDIEAKAEMALLPYMEDCTLLKVAHHGSDSSSIYPTLKKLSPEIAVISAGENPYGLPEESVIERLETISTEVYNTQTDGTVLFRTDGTFLERIIYDN